MVAQVPMFFSGCCSRTLYYALGAASTHFAIYCALAPTEPCHIWPCTLGGVAAVCAVLGSFTAQTKIPP